MPTTIKWAGTDATSGVNHYSLYRSKDGGAYTLVGTTTTPSDTVEEAPGHTYRFKVSATDNAGNTSSLKGGKAYTLSLVQENATSVKYSTGWTRQALTGANGGDVKYATAAGATATFSFNGIAAAWVSTVGPTQGSATAKLDTAAAKTIHTNAASAKTEQAVDVVTGPAGAHKLVITVAGTSGHPRIDVDAFVVVSS